MAPESPSLVLSAHRHDTTKRTDFYFLYNEGMITPPNEPSNLFEPAEGKPFNQKIHLQGEGRPYLMDAWSGKITPIANDVVAAIVAISPTLITPLAATPKTAVAASLPSPIDLTNSKWHLSVEDWQPANDYTATRVKATETKKETVQLDLDGLKPWPQIPALKDVSGVGTYTAIVNLPADWKPGTAALLNLGEVFDSFTLSVNGKAVPVKQISAAAEIGPLLHPGANTLMVRVVTTLNNRLSSLDPKVKRRGLIQNYGLIGPVELSPHH